MPMQYCDGTTGSHSALGLIISQTIIVKEGWVKPSPLSQSFIVLLTMFQHANEVTQLALCPIMPHYKRLVLLTQLAQLSLPSLQTRSRLPELLSSVCECLLSLCQLLTDKVMCGSCLADLQGM